MLWQRRRTRCHRLAAVFGVVQYDNRMTAIPTNTLTADELRVLQMWHEHQADQCRDVGNDEAAVAHDDRAIELTAMRELQEA